MPLLVDLRGADLRQRYDRRADVTIAELKVIPHVEDQVIVVRRDVELQDVVPLLH